MACAGPDVVLDYLGHRLTTSTQDAFELHLDRCTSCRELLAEMGHLDLSELLDRPSMPLDDGDLDKRYKLGELLGRGGMGEVIAALDLTMQREVAVKRMLGTAADENRIARFLREVRVQGQLEHPSIVPIHDLSNDANGRPYFIMKRVAGTTLADRLASPNPARRSLLGTLVEVCLAIDFAHTRGVVHRDLKPSNIMLGDFGEVYVLDWGVAKLVGHADVGQSDGETAPHDDIATAVGTRVGTPAYMSPEQARGELIEVRADVYALGCVLFEILTGRRWDRGAPVRPSTVAEVPPELDDVCARALAPRAEDRPSARELANGIQAYLDGDRDLARRRELAAVHVEAAREAIGQLGDRARSIAMREAGRALAYDPEHLGARDLVGRLLLDAPTQIPAEAKVAANAMRARVRRSMLRKISLLYFGVAMMIAGCMVIRHLQGAHLISLVALNTILGGLCVYLGTRDTPLQTRWYWIMLGLNTLQLAGGCLILGPLLMSLYVFASLAGWLSIPTGRPSWITITAHLVPFLTSFVLEALHVISSTYSIDGGTIAFTPRALDLTTGTTATILVVALFTLSMNLVIVFVMRRGQDEAQDRLHSHAWHLEQIVSS